MSTIVGNAKIEKTKNLRRQITAQRHEHLGGGGLVAEGERDGLLSRTFSQRHQTIKDDFRGLVGLLKDEWPLNTLLLVLPFAIASPFVGWSQTIVFVLNLVAIIPLANLLGTATEELALRTGDTVGGLLNATFGNAVELILSLAALHKGLIPVVQGSLLGSILANLLLVLGASFLVGGLKHPPEQRFNLTGASTFSSLLLVSVIGLAVPTVYEYMQQSAGGGDTHTSVLLLSRIEALFLGVVYLVYLVFQLRTHTSLFTAETDHDHEQAEEEPILSVGGAIVLLLAVTAVVAMCSEFLTSTIEDMTEHLSPTFIGVILLPIVGNAAEHATAVTVACKNKMDLAIGVAVGSSTQIALFLMPLVTLVGWVIGQPMDLNFQTFNTVILLVTVMIVNLTLTDGKSNYLEGLMLLAVYCIIAMACWLNTQPL